jgi:hypothetical protein
MTTGQLSLSSARRLAPALLLLAVTGCPGGPAGPSTPPPATGGPDNHPITLAPLPEPDKLVTIFFTGDVQGHVEPCGCTKDPLGGVDRLAGFLAEARKHPKAAGDLLVDAGDLLFEAAALEIDREAVIDRAGLIAGLWHDLGCAAAMTGPRDKPKNGPDLSAGPLAALPRLDASDPAKRRVLKEVGGVPIGVFGAAASDSGAPAADDPLGAARADVEELKKQGAKVIVALAYGGPKFGRELARKVGGVSFVIVASGDPDHVVKPGKEPVLRGDAVESGAVVLEPFSQGQSVGAIELRIVGGSLDFADGDRPARQKRAAEAAEKKIEEFTKKIEEAKKTNQDYSSLVEPLERQKKKREEAARDAEAPVKGSHFVTALTLLGSAVPKDEGVSKKKEDFVIAQGEKFKLAAKSEVLPAPKPTEAGYVGAEVCKDCHSEEYEFWEKTDHFHALETLKTMKRDGQPDCVSCHVAGFRKPGGTTLVSRVEELAGVQCENCHGPGSRHAEALGKDKPLSVNPVPGEPLCRGCHYPPHTDGFEFSERIKKVIGPGHQHEKK